MTYDTSFDDAVITASTCHDEPTACISLVLLLKDPSKRKSQGTSNAVFRMSCAFIPGSLRPCPAHNSVNTSRVGVALSSDRMKNTYMNTSARPAGVDGARRARLAQRRLALLQGGPQKKAVRCLSCGPNTTQSFGWGNVFYVSVHSAQSKGSTHGAQLRFGTG